MPPAPLARHLLRAKDLIDARYREPLDVPALARVAHLLPAHFRREFDRTFGATPHQYLLTRRMERAAALLRTTDRPETAEQVRSLLAKGAMGALFVTTEAAHATYEELKSRGVEFTPEPTRMPYGIDAPFRDPFGNEFRMVQAFDEGEA